MTTDRIPQTSYKGNFKNTKEILESQCLRFFRHLTTSSLIARVYVDKGKILPSCQKCKKNARFDTLQIRQMSYYIDIAIWMTKDEI